MNKVAWRLLACSLALVHCGGEYEHTPEGAAGAGLEGGAGSDANANANASHAGVGCKAGAGGSAGELSAYEALRTACKLELVPNRRGASSIGGYSIK